MAIYVPEETDKKIDYLFDVFMDKRRKDFEANLSLALECANELEMLLVQALDERKPIVDRRELKITGYVLYYYLHLIYTLEKFEVISGRMKRIKLLLNKDIVGLLKSHDDDLTSAIGLLALVKRIYTTGDEKELARTLMRDIFEYMRTFNVDEATCGDFDCRRKKRDETHFLEWNRKFIIGFMAYLEMLISTDKVQVVKSLEEYCNLLLPYVGMISDLRRDVLYISTMMADDFNFYERALSSLFFGNYTEDKKIILYFQIKRIQEELNDKRLVFITKASEQHNLKKHSPYVCLRYEDWISSFFRNGKDLLRAPNERILEQLEKAGKKEEFLALINN